MKANSNRLWIVAIALGWLFDFLFFEHTPGVNFAIYVVLCLAGGTYILLGVEKAKPAREALWLLIPLLFFAATTFVRAEPMTTVLAHILTLFLMGVFVITYLGGRWFLYSIWDYIFGTVWMPKNGRDIRLGFPGVDTYPHGFFSQLFKPFSRRNI